MPPSVTCYLCDRVFTKRCSLNRHLNRVHNIVAKCSRKAIVCPVENCKETFSYHVPLRSHLSTVHLVRLQDEQLTFLSMQEFFEWKKKEEQKYSVKYVKACGVQRLLDGTEVFRFNCHRTGTYTPEGKGLRRLKSQGSCKIGASCPSTVTAHRHPNGSVHGLYCMTHVGHESGYQDSDISSGNPLVPNFGSFLSPVTGKIIHEPRELPVVKVIYSPKPFISNRNKIELQSNVPISYRIHAMANGAPDGDQVAVNSILVKTESIDQVFEDIWKLSNKDVHEQFQAHLRCFEDSQLAACLKNNEICSQMTAFSEELDGNQEENPLTMYPSNLLKDTEDDADEGEDSAEAILDNFNLFVMNSWQVQVLKRFTDGGVLCIDTVYGRYPEDYIIVAVFVRDDRKHDWLLCALYFCFKIDCKNLEVCFTKIKNKTGALAPKVFMSEDDDQIYSSWEKVMGKCDHRLLCPWHVDRILRNKLKTAAVEPITLACTYESVRALLDCCFERMFNEALDSLTKDLSTNEHAKPFLEFLNEAYISRKAVWANFDKSELDREASKRLEAIHLLVHHVCHHDQKNLGQALYSLFFFFRERSLEYMCCGETMQPSLMTCIENEHVVSLSLDFSSIRPFDAQFVWGVKMDDIEYIVAQAQDACLDGCDVRCSSCSTCLHTFSCSCLSNLIQWKLCRHIHLVGRYLENGGHAVDYQNIFTEESTTILDEGCVVEATSDIMDDVLDSQKSEARDEILSEIETYARQIIVNASLVVDDSELLKLKASLKATLELSDSLTVTTIGEEFCDHEVDTDSQYEQQQLINSFATLDHDYM